MNAKIFKYEIPELKLHFTIEMPKGAKILSVQAQQNKPVIWALVNPANPTNKHNFYVPDTGVPIIENEEDLVFIGTFQMDEGKYVHHLFEIRKS